MKKVSIIVPCYNVEKYIESCLNSLINQEYKNIEILCIDDGSKDNTKEIIENFLEKDKRIQYFYKENGGLSSARNYGLKYVDGYYCCFIDSDDYVDSTYVSKLVNSIEKNNSKMAVCEFDRVYGKHITHKEMKMKDIENYIVPAAWNKMFISDYFKDLSFPEGLWYEDLATIPKYIMKHNKVSIVNESLYFYIQNPKSIMHTSDNRIFQIYNSIDCIEKYAFDNNIYNDYQKNLEFANIYHIIIGTVFRASGHSDFSINMINDIVSIVEKKYPDWYNNCMIKKDFSFVYKAYLWFIKKKMYFIIYLVLKLFGRFMHL